MSRGKRIRFFATRDDLIEAFDCKRIFGYECFKYVDMSMFYESNIPEYTCIQDIPKLEHYTGSSTCTDNYLIFSKDVQIIPEVIQLYSGEMTYRCKPWSHGEGIVTPILQFSPGGVSPNGLAYIYGELSTCSDKKETLDAFKALSGSIKKCFIGVHGLWLGKDVLDKYYNKLRFVTIGQEEPVEYDFRFRV